MPWASTASFKHEGQGIYSSCFKFGENGSIKILVHFCLQVSFGGILSKFLVFPTHSLIQPWASPASFKHEGQFLYSSCFKFGENVSFKILVHFCLKVHGLGICSKFLVFSTHSLIGLGPSVQVSSMLGRPSTQVASNFVKMGQTKFWSIFASRCAVGEFVQYFSLFITQLNMPWASPASFKHVLHELYSRGVKRE